MATSAYLPYPPDAIYAHQVCEDADYQRCVQQAVDRCYAYRRTHIQIDDIMWSGRDERSDMVAIKLVCASTRFPKGVEL